MALFKVALIACPLSAFLFPLSSSCYVFLWEKLSSSVVLLEWDEYCWGDASFIDKCDMALYFYWEL